MNSLTLSGLFLLICVIKISSAGVIKRETPLLTEETKEEFERNVRLETEEFLNNFFQNQINFFNNVKTSLNSETQRFKDIETFVEKLVIAKQEKDLTKKDELFYNSLKKFDNATLLLNEESETGLKDDEYQQILEDNGIKTLMKNFLADVAVNFLAINERLSIKVITTLRKRLSLYDEEQIVDHIKNKKFKNFYKKNFP